MQTLLRLSLVGLMLTVSAAPVLARPAIGNGRAINFVGPRGGVVSGTSILTPNPRGGVSGTAEATVVTPGSQLEVGGQVFTNGRRTLRYEGQVEGTTPRGREVDVTTRGTVRVGKFLRYRSNLTTISGGSPSAVDAPVGIRVEANLVQPTPVTPAAPVLARPIPQPTFTRSRFDRSSLPASRVWPQWSDNILVVPVNP